ncbi:DUF58 domain-containing protein [Shewanella kaireitica]|uniref:DUF58 domain-containing protein n=1 Tax=Shewanella kaireitica TaxID=212021 RepID=UPI00200C9BCC|nr:DUF58 domain-containing protein [Shewanella kaireitica]
MDFKSKRLRKTITRSDFDLQSLDPRIYCELQTLVALKPAAEKLSFQQGQFRTSAQVGRHNSKVRGRGLNFEELRHYQDGDDVKNMDWRTTMRTGKPHVRAYSEEKERQALIVVDQRASMFFGSEHAMKSVVAAQLSALSAWTLLRSGDRVGGLVFDDHQSHYTKPRRSSANVLSLFQSIIVKNHKLNAESYATKSHFSLNKTLLQLDKISSGNSTIIIVSDWQGFNDESLTLLKHLQRKNDVVLVYVHDQFERELHHISDLVATDGSDQLSMIPKQINHQSPNFYKHYSDQFKQKLHVLNCASRTQILPVIEIDTDGSELNQFCSALGRRAN